jgi:hypothetical protein
MKSRKVTHTKDGALLINVAGSIGSALDAIAGGAYAVQQALSGNPGTRKVKRGGKKPVKKSKTAVGETRGLRRARSKS